MNVSLGSSIRRAIMTSYQPYAVDVAKHLFDRRICEPALWFVADENRARVKVEFPFSRQYEYFELVKGILPPWMTQTELSVVSPEELYQLAPYESIFLYMIERNDSNYSAFEFKQRLSFYYFAVSLWKTVLTSQSIDVVIFEEEPHQAMDYALFLTARLLGVETVMTIRTIAELGLLPVHDFEVGSARVSDAYNGVIKQYLDTSSRVPISLQVESYFQKLNADYESVLQSHLWDQVDEYRRLADKTRALRFGFGDFLSKAKKAAGVLSRIITNETIRSDQYKPGGSLQDSAYTYSQYLWNKLRGIRTKKSLRRVYRDLSLPEVGLLPNNKKVAYVALQYQPEKSTSPLAGRFVDQCYMVRLLAKALGDDWTVLVKEHPSQFIDSYARFGECFRSKAYYEDLLSIPNVFLAGLNLDSFTLIDRSDLVASAGGTVCWEAVARGKPAISFALSWFKDCHGIFYIHDQKSLMEAVECISNSFKPDPYLVRAFAQVVNDLGYDGVVGGASNLAHKAISEEENAQVIAHALSDTLLALDNV